MKYEVTFSCGHTGTVQLYGKGDERERKIRYFEEYGVCSECYKERRAIEAEIGCNHVTMSYRAYKTDYSFCDVLNDSYDKQEKTITVLVPEALADFIDAKNKGGATLFNAAIKVATNNKDKAGKHYAECYKIVKAYIKEHADFAKELQAYMQQQKANKIVVSNITMDEEQLVRMYIKQFDTEINDNNNKLTITYKDFNEGSLISEYLDCLAKIANINIERA
nr:MAG TPA: hypothetical protein [Caudoviricetes sp.]